MPAQDIGTKVLKRLKANDPTLTEFEIDGLTVCSLRELTCALEHNSFLEKINVSNISLDTSFLQAVATLAHLRHLGLTSCSLTVATAKSIPISAHLETLDLAETKLGPRGCKVLVDALRQSRLRVLNLNNAGLGHYGAQAIATGLPATLQSLNLSHNALGHDGLWKLAEGFERLLCLQCLDLSFNNCLDDGCLEVAKHVVPVCHHLTRLHLAGNRIGDTGMQALAASLSGTSVQELYVQKNNITCVGVKALAEHALPSSCKEDEQDDVAMPGERSSSKSYLCSALRIIDLSSNQIGSDGCSSLAIALSESENRVSTLDLSNNAIEDEGAGSFVELLDDLPGLKHLDLGGNNFSDARIRILGMLLRHRTRGSHRGEDTTESSASTARGDQIETSVGSTQNTADTASVDKGRTLLQSLDLKTSAATELPLAYVLDLTDSFDEHRIIQHGTFGQLFAAKDDTLSGIDIVLRRTVLNTSSLMESVRDTVLAELIHLRHDNLLRPIAYSTCPTSCNVLYNVNNRVALADVLQDEEQRKTMVWTSRVGVLKGIAEALQYLHTGNRDHKTTFHGDVRPHNVYVSPDCSRVEVADCGLGRMLGTDRLRFASGDVVFGSRGYRCPRYERGSCCYSAASDVFSFGVLVVEMLTGRLQSSKSKSSMACDHYYDLMILKQPLQIDASAGSLVRDVIDPLVQLSAKCMLPVLDKRPGMVTIVDILYKLKP